MHKLQIVENNNIVNIHTSNKPKDKQYGNKLHHCYDCFTKIQKLKNLYDNYKYNKKLNLMKDVENFQKS